MRRRYRIGDRFKLSDDALENYGEKYRDQVFTVRGVFDHYVSPAFMARDPTGHPGFDANGGSPLYEADDAPGALYEWEMERA
jgi:hypothetical protein